MRLTTLIVDDEPLAREGLRALLARDPEISAIREARNGREAVLAIRESKPDLVLLECHCARQIACWGMKTL